jgi:hypothetical protein
MIDYHITIDDKDIQAAFQRLDLLPALRDGAQAAGTYLEGKIAAYPPETEANAPGPYPKHWYVRGTGPHWALKGGGVHFRKTSQTLGRRWTTQTTQTEGEVVTRIGNNATYAPYVHDQRYQAKFHGARGWKTAQGVISAEMGHIKRIVGDFIRARIKSSAREK